MFCYFYSYFNIFQTPFPRVQDVWLSHFNNQLSDCFVPASEDVLEHQLPVGEVVDPPQGVQEGVDVLAVGEDAALRVLVPRDVGPVVVNEQVPDVSRGDTLVNQNLVQPQEGVREVVLSNQALVQTADMSLTELVLLHRDAQILNCKVIMESAKAPSSLRVSHPSRPGCLGDEFVKLFKLKQVPVFAITSATSSFSTPLEVSTVVDSSSVSTTPTTLVPVSSLMSKVPTSSTSLETQSSSPRTPVLSSTTSLPSKFPDLVEDQLHLLDQDGILGSKGDLLSHRKMGEKCKDLVESFVYDSIAPGTLRLYKANWQLFKSYGKISGINVEKYDFDFLFVCNFMIYRLQRTSSLSSVLSARSAINFFWKINSSSDCPTDSKFVSLFLKGVERKFKKIPKKAYPISYDELQQIFDFVIGDSDIESLPFVELRFITYLITSYSSFARYEELAALKVEDVYREDDGFVLNFKKGKAYQYGECHIGVLSNLPRLKFNPAKIFSLYLDKLAIIHSNSHSPSNYLFPSLRNSRSILHSLDKPVSYSLLLSKFKFCVKEVGLPIGLSKVGLHSLRRGGGGDSCCWGGGDAF